MNHEDLFAAIPTALQHAGREERVGQGLLGAIEQSVTFRVDSHGEMPVYQRLSNTSNHREIEAVVAALHGAEAAFLTNSGMSALSVILMSMLKPGDHILCQSGCYGGTQGLLEHVLRPLGFSVSFADLSEFADRVQPQTRVLLVESISNPHCLPQDLRIAAAAGQKVGARLIVDNTFASPINCQPLRWGADLVFESATKYLNGHSDQVAGAIAGSGALIRGVRKHAMYLGSFLNTEGCAKLLRGMRTLAVRMSAHNANGLQVARSLAALEGVETVSYGGLDEHGGAVSQKHHEIFSGYGGMMALRFEASVCVEEVLRRLKLVSDVPSLGGTETTACMPLHTTHRWTSPEECRRQNVDRHLLRLSVGLEDPADIAADFQQALQS